MGYCLIYITTKDVKEARKISKTLLDKRLVACCNIVPSIESYYWWKGKFCEDEEALIFAKTVEKLADKVVTQVKKIHSYDVPDISVIRIDSGNLDFFKWISQETRG